MGSLSIRWTRARSRPSGIARKTRAGDHGLRATRAPGAIAWTCGSVPSRREGAPVRDGRAAKDPDARCSTAKGLQCAIWRSEGRRVRGHAAKPPRCAVDWLPKAADARKRTEIAHRRPFAAVLSRIGGLWPNCPSRRTDEGALPHPKLRRQNDSMEWPGSMQRPSLHEIHTQSDTGHNLPP